MRIIHSGGFPDDERRQTRAVIYSNVVIAFKVLLDIMRTESIEFEQEKTKVNKNLSQPLFYTSLIYILREALTNL